MLIEFSVSNFRSFRERVTFSMVASSSNEHSDSHVFEPGNAKAPRLLRSAAIYGANASGKSNLLLAIKFMKKFVQNSAREDNERNPIETDPFLFDKKSKNNPSEFELIFINDGIKYQYGFSVNEERVLEEWLFAFPEGRSQKWFTRTYVPKEGRYEWYINSANLTGDKKSIQAKTKRNSLFLSTASMMDNKQLSKVQAWFRNKLRIVLDPSELITYTIDKCGAIYYRDKILNILNSAGIGINDIRVGLYEFPVDTLPGKTLPDKLIKSFAGQRPFRIEGKHISVPDIQMIHAMNDSDKTVGIDMNEESKGTQNLFAFAAPWIDTLENGRVLLIDEFESSLHTHIVRNLLRTINSKTMNPNNAQLVFTTHSTSLLDNDIFRRDQIWFAEKNKGATNLYSLYDFKPRKGEAIEKGYLHGKYGAIPFIGDVKF
jgi:hypothetical protein